MSVNHKEAEHKMATMKYKMADHYKMAAAPLKAHKMAEHYKMADHYKMAAAPLKAHKMADHYKMAEHYKMAKQNKMAVQYK